MSEHQPDHTPWPLWASKPHERDELAALLGVSARSVRRGVQKGHIELVEGPDYHHPLYRLRDCAWSRRHLQKMAAMSRPNGRHGQGGQTAIDRGQSDDEAHSEGVNDRGQDRGQVDATSQKMAATNKALSVRVEELEQENAHLRGQVEQLTRALELALASRPPSTPWLIVQLVALWNWFKSRGERG